MHANFAKTINALASQFSQFVDFHPKLLNMPDSFTDSRYPSVEETLRNNATSLYKQKRQFLADVRTLMGTSASALIGILYLRDVSLFLFFLRATTQFLLSNPYATNARYMLVLSEEARKDQRWFLFWTVAVVNVISFFIHFIFGAYKSSSASDKQLHGGMSVQFIGERLPFGRYELMALDCLILILQLLYFCLMCTIDDSAVLSGHSAELGLDNETVQLDVVSDGFDGNVNLLTLDVFAGIQASWRYQTRPVPDGGESVSDLRERALRRMLV